MSSLLRSLVLPIFLSGCETLTFTASAERMIKAFEIKLLEAAPHLQRVSPEQGYNMACSQVPLRITWTRNTTC